MTTAQIRQNISSVKEELNRLEMKLRTAPLNDSTRLFFSAVQFMALALEQLTNEFEELAKQVSRNRKYL